MVYWFLSFKKGKMSIENQSSPGRPSTLRTDDNVEKNQRSDQLRDIPCHGIQFRRLCPRISASEENLLTPVSMKQRLTINGIAPIVHPPSPIFPRPKRHLKGKLLVLRKRNTKINESTVSPFFPITLKEKHLIRKK